jgi:hypothetical protein
MVKGLFRCFLIISVLALLIFGFETKAFSNSFTLADAYNALVGNGWSVKDALGFLGASLAGTLSLSPAVAPAVAAGALSAYIVAKGAQLYDLYREWRNLRIGIALLNPVEFSQSMSVKGLRNGEYGWQSISVYVTFAYGSYWDFGLIYRECSNNGGSIQESWYRSTSGRVNSGVVISRFNEWLNNYVPVWRDEEGKAIFTSLVSTAYNYLISGANFSGSYSRRLVPALELDVGEYDTTLGYRVSVDPAIISEDGVQYLGDPDSFYGWFLDNYMGGVNQGTFITPTTPSYDSYDQIRSDLQVIIDQLNDLLATGGVSEETLNEVKTDIINTVTTSESNILNAHSTLTSTLTSLFDSISSVQTSIDSLQTDIDALADEINETQQQEQGFFEDLLNWLRVTFWEKLRELLRELLDGLKELLISLYELLVVPENAAEIWQDTVAGWMDMVSWDDLNMPAFSVSGDTFEAVNIPIGDGYIPINIGEYVSQTGLRDLLTGIIVFSLWLGFLLKLLPRFAI